jgi:uncharacterized membrane protein
MTILSYLLFATLFAVLPAGVIWLCRRYPLLDNIGPIMILYAIGMLIGNLPLKFDGMATVQMMAQNISIPLAIPMMLFACSFKRGEVRTQLVVIISGFLSVAIAVVAGYMLFGRNMSEGAEVGGIVSGMYTGGTLNAASLQKIFSTSKETFMLISSYDIVISLLYFVFLFTFGIRLFRRLYGEKLTLALSDKERCELESEIAEQRQNRYARLLKREGRIELAKILGVTLLVVALSAGVALPFGGLFMVIFILMLTTLGVACSFIRGVGNLSLSFDIGMYLIYIFSLSVASMADFSMVDLDGGVSQIAFMSCAVFLSLMLHAIFCRIARVSADAMVISSVSFINSPPFVPMVAVFMRNRSVLITGLSAGVVGYALGTHFGVLMSSLLGGL